jgi:hypothetical protein
MQSKQYPCGATHLRREGRDVKVGQEARDEEGQDRPQVLGARELPDKGLVLEADQVGVAPLAERGRRLQVGRLPHQAAHLGFFFFFFATVIVP